MELAAFVPLPQAPVSTVAVGQPCHDRSTPTLRTLACARLRTPDTRTPRLFVAGNTLALRLASRAVFRIRRIATWVL